MPDKTTEERLATLEAQVQGLASSVAEQILDPAYRLEWGMLDEDPEPRWIAVYDWKRDPSHPLHQRGKGAETHA